MGVDVVVNGLVILDVGRNLVEIVGLVGRQREAGSHDCVVDGRRRRRGLLTGSEQQTEKSWLE